MFDHEINIPDGSFDKLITVLQYTVKHAHSVTCIKQSTVFKGPLFLLCHRKFHIN